MIEIIKRAPSSGSSTTANTTLITSSTSITLAQSSLTWTYSSVNNIGIVVGDRVKIYRTSAPSTYYMIGAVTAISSTSITVTVDIQTGNGTYSDWTIQLILPGGVMSLPGTQSNSEKYGFGSSSTGFAGHALGRYANASGSASIAIGYLATASATNTIAIGYNTTASATNTIAIGTSNTVSSSISLGFSQTISSGELGSITIGHQAKNTGSVTPGGYGIAIGYQAEATSWRSIAIGGTAKTGAVSSTAIGYGAVTETPHGLALGRGSYIPTGFNNAICLGYSGGNSATEVYLDVGMYSHFISADGVSAVNTRNAASCPARYLGMAGRDKAGLVGDLNGGDIEICGGASTGTGIGGKAKLRVTPSGSSGVSVNALVDMFAVSPLSGLEVRKTITSAGTTGTVTIDRPMGTVNIAGGNSSITVNNSLVNTSSIIYPVIRTDDTTAQVKNVVPGSGSFVINLVSAATAETSIGFIVYN